MFPKLHIGRDLVLWLALTITYAVSVLFLVDKLDIPKWSPGDEVSAILGIVIGTLLVFRNNAAYDRWWEARKLWGQLNNDIRNLALKTRAHAAIDNEQRAAFGRLLIGFAHSLRLRLRGSTRVQDVAGFADDATECPHAPGYIAGLIHQALNQWNRQGSIVDTVWLFDQHARGLMDVCGACERIQNTPLASSYRALTGYGIALYLLAAPWGVALDQGWTSLPALIVAFVFLLGVELTAISIEEPFGKTGDDLNLDEYCGNISTFVSTELGTPQTLKG